MAGELAYVVGGWGVLDSGWLRVIDVSNPVLPVEVGALDTLGGFARDVEVVGDLAYVIHSDFFPVFTNGLRVIDVSNPAFPVEVGALDMPGGAYDLEVVGDLAYVSDGRIELRYRGRSFPFRAFDENRRVTQADIVSNKRLGDVVQKIQAKQRKRDEERLANKSVTLRRKKQIRTARAQADGLPGSS